MARFARSSLHATGVDGRDSRRRRESGDTQVHARSGGNEVAGSRRLRQHSVLGLERAGVARDSAYPQPELLECQPGVGHRAAGEIGQLERGRSLTDGNSHHRWERERVTAWRVASDHRASRLLACLLPDRTELEAGILDCQARLLLGQPSDVGDNRTPLPSAHSERDVDSALLKTAGGRVLLQDDVLCDAAVKSSLTPHRAEAGFFDRGHGGLERQTYDGRHTPVIREHLRRKRKKEEQDVRQQKPEDADDEIRERTPSERAPLHLVRPPESRRERAIRAVPVWKNAQISAVERLRGNGCRTRRLELPVLVSPEEALDLLLILFGLERAGTVDE